MKISKFLTLFSLLLLIFSCKNNGIQEYKKLNGLAFGTSFYINYNSSYDYADEIDSLFNLINNSLSTYLNSSDISKINRGDSTLIVDAYFKEVFEKSSKIYKETQGVFDPSVGVLVNAWGFGPEKVDNAPDSILIAGLLSKVGFDKVSIKDGRVVKEQAGIYFDFNAIAKGYAVDVAGRFLEAKNISNYLVEIGGEIRARGKNEKGLLWKAGIENPNFDGSRSIKKVIELNNESIATSGSYRKFKIDSASGQKYTHIIDSRLGYPKKGDLLSVSIVSQRDCADVDGYATALMAMRLDEARQFLKEHKDLKGYLIYSDSTGNIKTYSSSNF